MADKPLAPTTLVPSNGELGSSIEALESRNAFQDDIIDQLNTELTIHQEEIALLKAQLKIIANRIKDNISPQSDTPDVEPPPPHY